MTADAIRNTTLPLLALIVGGAVLMPKQPKPRIECSPEERAGQRFWCTVHLANPPAQPDYRWSTVGDCEGPDLGGQTIMLTAKGATPGASDCTVRVIVRDRPDGPTIGGPVATTITFPSVVAQPSPGTGQHSTGEREPRPPRLRPFYSPDARWREGADAAAVQGQVEGTNLSAYMVALYTKTASGWTRQGEPVPIATADAQGGFWQVNTTFGDAYAAVLGRKPFSPPLNLRSQPRMGEAGALAVQISK